jgi:hypothetical protein
MRVHGRAQFALVVLGVAAILAAPAPALAAPMRTDPAIPQVKTPSDDGDMEEDAAKDDAALPDPDDVSFFCQKQGQAPRTHTWYAKYLEAEAITPFNLKTEEGVSPKVRKSLFGETAFGPAARIKMCKDMTEYARAMQQDAEKEAKANTPRKDDAQTAVQLAGYLKKKKDAFRENDRAEAAGEYGTDYWVLPDS